jgi:hypothetical protein
MRTALSFAEDDASYTPGTKPLASRTDDTCVGDQRWVMSRTKDVCVETEDPCIEDQGSKR